MTSRYFLFGAGYSAKAFAALARRDGDHIAGTTRKAENFPALQDSGIAPFVFDGSTAGGDLVEELKRTTHVLISIAPNGDDPVLAVARAVIATAMPHLRWIGYYSTLSVYGDHEGRWISEDAICNPVSRHARQRLDAELAWQALGREINVPVAIMRIAGIYGPGRNALANLESGTARRIIKPGQVFNRIHVDDIAGATLLLAQGNRGGVYNFSDDLPAPAEDVVTFAADLMGVAPPPEIAFEDADLSPMGRSFYEETKRAANDALKAEGYRFVYPDYRTALQAMWADGTYRGGNRALLGNH